MKLRNKKTGETGYLRSINWNEIALIIMDKNGVQLGKYGSIAELNEEWCDYEEPKGNWTIDPMNEDYIDNGKYTTPDELERYEELGLKFNAKEEAEKAVEKLKAWKRLKDKGFKFDGVNGCWIEFTLKSATSDEDFEQGQKDLHLLFGGEE